MPKIIRVLDGYHRKLWPYKQNRFGHIVFWGRCCDSTPTIAKTPEEFERRLKMLGIKEDEYA